MKKLTAVFAVVLLLVSLLSFGVHAEGFVFREVSRTQNETQMQVVWNYEELSDGDELEDITAAGISLPFTMDDEKTLLIDISALDAGIYPIVYDYVSGATGGSTKAADLIKSGMATVKLTAAINSDGTVTITAKNASGAAVPNYMLSLTIGNMSGLTGKTDAGGRYTSYITLDYGQTVLFEGRLTTSGLVNYSPVSQQSMVRERPATTTAAPTTTTTGTTTADTTTTAETTDTTTDTTEDTTVADTTVTAPDGATVTTPNVQTNASVFGAGTTAVKNDKVVLNVSTDTALLKLFGCDKEAFADKARLYVSQADYTSLIGRNTDNMLMLNMLTSAQPVSEAQIRAALQNASAFSAYGEDERAWVTFDLSFLLLSEGGKVVPVSAVPIDSTYVVELPVPASMKGCKELAVTLKDGDGLMTPVKVAVSGGTFKLEINSLEPYTLIGFGTGGSEKAGGVSTVVVVLIIVGVLLLAGAGVLLWLFVFRKPASAEEEDEAPAVIVTQPEDNDTDIYSGRTDLPPSDGD